MTAYPIWFGNEERPLFGWIHLPDQAAAGVVLCSPIGIEGSPGYRGFTVLAKRLEAAGIVVLRFDYTGTGDSASDTDSVPSVDIWAEDIKSAIELVRSTGVSQVCLVGLRIGALLAAHVAPEVLIDALVLWDPCLSGRRFLREQAILGSVVPGVGNPNETSDMDIPSIDLPQELARTLTNVDLGLETGALPKSVFVLTRPDRPVDRLFRNRLGEVHTDWAEAPEQYKFFESTVPYMPEGTIKEIAEWCIAKLRVSSSDVVEPQCPPMAWSPATLSDSAGTSVIERPVLLDEAGLFGIFTEPSPTLNAKDDSFSPKILLINLAGDRRTGPSRLWVKLGRRWAGQGMSVLRLDLRGLGDSPARPGESPYEIYPANGIDDVIAGAHFLSPGDPSEVLIVGVCSGAYHAAEAAMVLKSRVLWLINPGVPTRDSFNMSKSSSSMVSPRQVVRRADPLSRRLSRMTGPVNLAHRLMPNVAWWLLDRLGLYTYTIRAFDPLLEQGTEIFLMCGTAESVPYVNRAHRALIDRQRSGLFHLELAESLDHALMMAASRRVVSERLDEYVAQQIAENQGIVNR